MPQHSAFNVPWLTATLILAAPMLVLLLILVATGELPWLDGVLGAGAVVLMDGFLTRRHLESLAKIASYANALANQQPASPPRSLSGAMTGEVLAAVRRMDRVWQGRAEALRGSIPINTSLLDSLPDPIILLDGDRHVLFSNAAARRQLGSSGIGGDLAGLVRDPRVLEGATAVLQGGERREVSFEIIDPAKRQFAVRIEPLPGDTAGGGACVIAMLDLTAMKRTEETRSDFIANASHELRTPLSILIGFIETLRGPARDDPAAREQFLELMPQQAERMARLLSLSTIEMSEHTPPSGEVALGNLLRGVADALQLQARARSIEIDLQIEPGLPEILGDADQLTQLFQNLVVNAIRYGAAESGVTVTARADYMPDGKEGESVIPVICVSVKDQGEGIPKEHLPRLTERFYRVDAARSRAVGGTGLGLAIVKHIVNRHRGVLRIESEPGHGTTVFVYLPVARESSVNRIA